MYEASASDPRNDNVRCAKTLRRSTSSDSSRLSTPVGEIKLSTVAIVPIKTNSRKPTPLYVNSSYLKKFKICSPSVDSVPLQPTIICNPSLTLEDAHDPLAFAVSDVSYKDLNLKL